MRLLFITPGFAADENDHNCIPPLQHLVRDLGRKGAEVQIIALEYPYRNRSYRWHTATVHPCGGRNRRWLRWRTYIRALMRAWNLSEDGRFDFAHSFWLGSASKIGDWFAESTKTAHFITCMGQDVLPENNLMKAMSPERAARMIVLSDYHKKVFEKVAGVAPGHLIPWGIPDAEVPKKLEAERPVDVIGVGSLVPVKNWHSWLKTIRLLVDQKPGLQAVAVGEGPLEKSLKKTAEELGIAQNVEFTGLLPRSEVLSRMRGAKVFLHASGFESFGFVLSEALANGCRVVATPVGIAPELPTAATADNENDLAQKILEALDAPGDFRAQTPFTMHACGWAYWDLYHSG